MPRGMNDAPWLEFAWRDLGVAERAGPASEPRVVDYYREAGHGEVTDDGVPWCAAFVGACLKRGGARATGSLMARSYAGAGRALGEPRLGAVAILSRGADPEAGHVGFVVGWSDRALFLLGGNQGDCVSIATFERARIVALRWPEMATAAVVPAASPTPSVAPAPASDVLFEAALAHVLEMEGGFTDDRFDPGGATNFGITIGDYASWRGEQLTADNHGRLRSDLKAITRATATEIYSRRYWQPSHAGDLPAALALMHFDAAVNHGLGGASRLLQAALAVTVDGEIGPDTLGAAAACDASKVVERYADLRRERYRALPHFWRFGRGWLARVDATVAASRRLTATPSANTPTEIAMTQTPEPLTPVLATAAAPVIPPVLPGKWWGHSMTIWGALITAAATVAPALGPILGPALGVTLTPDIVRQTAADVVGITQALAGVAGTVMTICGRLRANSRLETRSLVVRL